MGMDAYDHVSDAYYSKEYKRRQENLRPGENNGGKPIKIVDILAFFLKLVYDVG